MDEHLWGWKCSDWIERALTENKWFCKTICPFGRNGNDFISCNKDRKEILDKVIN